MVDQFPNSSSQRRTLIAFGLTGVGKSYCLNLLAGADDPDQAYFDVGTEVTSVTTSVATHKTILYGTTQPVLMVDVPGLADTS